MSEKTEKTHQVFQFANLSKYSLKQRMLVRLVGIAFYTFISILGKTIRFEIDGWENYEAVKNAGKNPIYTLWHNRLFAGIYFWRNRQIIVMTSQSIDGEYIARAIKRLGFGASRGSSSRGGKESLSEMVRLVKSGFSGAFTIDGPRGPKYVAKLGACLLAHKTQNPILPFSIELTKYWQAKNWDQLQIPKPFSKAKVFISKPIYISSKADGKEIENKRLELQNALDELVSRGVQWRESEKF